MAHSESYQHTIRRANTHGSTASVGGYWSASGFWHLGYHNIRRVLSADQLLCSQLSAVNATA